MKIATVDLNNDESLVGQLVAMAEHNDGVLDTLAQIEELVSASDMVFAVWPVAPDEAHPDGVGLLPVKGYSLLQQGCGSAKVSAIKCLDFEAACALAEAHGAILRVH
jgi:hypothetical protein